MTIYQQCSEAVTKLMENPPADHSGVFTEIDVVTLAGRADWSEDDYQEALRHANQVVGTQYRARKLCRYGPVTFPDGEKDYARIASKIVYAPADTGSKTWRTPNGTFKKLMMEDDNFGRQGRRRYTNRSDIVKWADQGIDVKAGKPYEKRIKQLERDLEAERERVAELESALRQSSVGGEVEERLRAVIEDFEARLARLEERERQRENVYAQAA